MLSNDVTKSFFDDDSIKDNYFATENDGWLVNRLLNDKYQLWRLFSSQ
jgi:hypothetical protein